MNKKEFIDKLTEKLSNLKLSEREEAISYYSEMIDDFIENGKSEKEAVKELGGINDIVNKIIENQESISKSENNQKERNISHIILLIIASPFIFIFFIIIMCLFISIYSLIFGVYCTAIALLLANIIVIIDLFVNMFKNLPYAIFEFGFVIFSFGISIMLILAMNMLIKKVNKFLLFVFKKFTNLVKGGEKNE